MSRRYASAHPCPTPSKRRYPSLDEARESIRRALSIGRTVEALWGYRCVCGSWHRTTKQVTAAGKVRPDQVRLLTPEQIEAIQLGRFEA